MRVFPLSNWTELDVWDYIVAEDIPVVPLYLAKERAGRRTRRRADHGRRRAACPWRPAKSPRMESVRFRTLGCYPLTGAIRSHAETLPEMIAEMRASTTSEREGRLIDHDESGSMEKKKREGYF